MDARLLVRPLPLAGEGLRGYFLRLADANGLLPNADLYRVAFGGAGLTGVTQARLERVARDFGLDAQALSRLGCRGMAKDPARCHYLGHRIAAQHLRGLQCAVCPLCLRSCTAVRADWELAAQAVCPDHGCWLVDRCSRCRRPIVWRRRSVQTCVCGQHLGAIETHPAAPAAVAYGRVLARRLFGDLEPVDERGPAVPALAAAPLNQLLCVFTLLRNSRFRTLEREAPSLPTWTARLRGQAATASAVGSVLADWPQQWRQALERVARPTSSPSALRRQIVSVEQARAPFVALQRAKWSAASEFPPIFRAELAKFLSERTMRVASRRYYTLGARTSLRTGSTERLAHLWCPGTKADSIDAADLLSAEAVRDLFDASPAQMQALQCVGILPKNRPWFTAREVDAGFEQLSRCTRSRPRAENGKFTALWEVGLTDSSELELALRRVMTGETPTFTWRHIRPAGLGNLFVRTPRGADATPPRKAGESA